MAEEEKTETTEETKTEASKEKPASSDSQKVEIPTKFKDLVKSIEGLSVLELSELVKILEKHFGVSAAAPMAAAAAPAASGDAAEAADEKTAYTIMLTDAGASKINVIKAVREITGLGLAESKALVDSAPKAVKENAPKAEAEEAKKALEEAGASVELQ